MDNGVEDDRHVAGRALVGMGTGLLLAPMLSLFPVLAIALVVIAIGAGVLTTLWQDSMRGAFAGGALLGMGAVFTYPALTTAISCTATSAPCDAQAAILFGGFALGLGGLGAGAVAIAIRSSPRMR